MSHVLLLLLLHIPLVEPKAYYIHQAILHGIYLACSMFMIPKLTPQPVSGCTAKAVTHRVSKIRNLAKNYVPNNDNGNTGTVSTPPATAGRKRSATKATAGEAEASPAKKSKSPVKAAAPKAKAKAAPIEADDDNSDDENGGSNVIKAEE